jgi:hypothetical protein
LSEDFTCGGILRDDLWSGSSTFYENSLSLEGEGKGEGENGVEMMRIVTVLIIVFMLLSCSKKEETFETAPLVTYYKNYRVSFEAEPWPVVPMKRTFFRVKITPPLKDDRLLMELTMPGMYMGQNRVVLKRVSEGVYEGTAVVVRCPSGKTLWRATIRADNFGPVTFDFHVKR